MKRKAAARRAASQALKRKRAQRDVRRAEKLVKFTRAHKDKLMGALMPLLEQHKSGKES